MNAVATFQKLSNSFCVFIVITSRLHLYKKNIFSWKKYLLNNIARFFEKENYQKNFTQENCHS